MGQNAILPAAKFCSVQIVGASKSINRPPCASGPAPTGLPPPPGTPAGDVPVLRPRHALLDDAGDQAGETAAALVARRGVATMPPQ